MALKPKNFRDFQYKLLGFLYETNTPEVHIYHHVMNAWSNEMTMLSLLEMKAAITELCDKRMISSKNNAHMNIGMPGIAEDVQMNEAICSLLPDGKKYYKRIRFVKILIKLFQILVLIAIILIALYTLYYFRKVFFKMMFRSR
jgi:hypothetical protein